MSLAKKAFNAIDANAVGHKIMVARRGALDALANPTAITHTPYRFTNRSQDAKSMCMILAGYKPELWDDVFARLKAYVPKDFDICILSSGVYHEKLEQIAEKYSWSYLSTEVNQLAHIQNKAIELFALAQWIYKIDEDIFVTKDMFKKMRECYDRVSKNTCWRPGFVAPLLNVNTYSTPRLLELCGLTSDFEAKTGALAVYSDGITHHANLLEDPRVARYMWGDGDPLLADLDVLSRALSLQEQRHSICPGRFSIGVLMFERDTWKAFDHFPVNARKNGLGDDEEHVAKFAALCARPILICENALAGHLGYGPQTKEMLAYHKNHPFTFMCKEENENENEQ